MQYDVIIIGAGPGGIFSAYELSKLCPEKKIAVFEEGQPLEKRKCPIDGKTVKHCVGCPTCAIMNGFGGAGAFSDGKYNLTNDFGGTLYEYIGKKQAMELMHYVDAINVSHGGENTRLYSTANSAFKTRCLQCNLHLLDASVRHLGTDINFVVLKYLFAELEPKVDFYFRTPVRQVLVADGGYEIVTDSGSYFCKQCIVSVGRSGSKWMESVCRELNIETKSNRVDIGVRVELPAEIFKHLTDELYESKIVYKTEKYQDLVRTFCMNPKGAVVTENTNGIVTVNGHSYEDPAKQTENTKLCPACLQALYRAFQGLQRLRRVHRTAFQHAWRRRNGAALRRFDPRPTVNAEAHRQIFRYPDPDGHAGRFVAGHSEAHSRRHHRDDLRA